MIKVCNYHNGTWTYIVADIDGEKVIVSHGPTPLDALIEAERVIRAGLDDIQRLLTAEREKTRTEKPQSPTY